MRFAKTTMAFLSIIIAMFITAPASSASAVIECQGFVVDQSAKSTLDHAEVAQMASAVQVASQSHADIYVRYVEGLTEQYTASVYDDFFREKCNPVTDYVLVVLDDKTTGVFFGSHFDRLTPSLHSATKHYLTEFYRTDDKNRAVMNLLDELKSIFELNPDHDNYVKYPDYYLVNGYVNENPGSPSTMTAALKATAIGTAICVIVLVGAVIALLVDKRDHRAR